MLNYKCLNDLAPSYLADLLELYKPSHSLRFGNQQNLKVPKTCLKFYGDGAFCHASPVLWNNSPLEITTAIPL